MMLRFRPSALLLVLSLLAVDANTKKDNNKKLRPRIHSPPHDLMRGLEDAPIVGGTRVTDPMKYPYFGNYLVCGGALIAPDIVLTAAHCEENNGLEFRMLSLDYRSGGISRTITQTVIHPDFRILFGQNMGAPWDFSVLKLSGNILVDENGVATGAEVIPMQRSNSIPVAGTDQQIMGFGNMMLGGPSSEFLYEVTLPSTSNEVCAASSPGDFILELNTCAGTVGAGQGACQGDSGGPQVDSSTVPPTVVGVASFVTGDECGDNPTVYARVSAAVDWITSTACSMTSFPSDLCPQDTPENDVCTGAIRISPGDIGIVGTTVSATPDNAAVPSFCDTDIENPAPGVWYTFTGTGFPVVALSTCDNDTRFFDTVISVYKGTCGSLTCVTANDNTSQEGNCLGGGATQYSSSQARFMAEAGVTYYILVYGSNGQAGRFGLSLLRPPPNDECAFATPINVGDTGIIGDTTLAPLSGMTDFCGLDFGDSQAVWYTFTGNGVMVLAASLCDENTLFDSAISVYKGACGELACVDSNDDTRGTENVCGVGAGDRSSEVEFMAEEGVQYYILVRGFAGDDGLRSGRFGLELTASSPTPAPTDSMAPTLSLYIEFSYISEFSFGFDRTLVDFPSDEDVMSLLRMTEVFYKRKVAESFSIPYQDVNVGDADSIQLTLDLLHSEFRNSRLFITFETKVTVRKRPGVPNAAQVESVLETFDSTTYLDDFVKVGGSVPFSFADSVLVTVSDNNNSS